MLMQAKVCKDLETIRESTLDKQTHYKEKETFWYKIFYPNILLA